MHLYLTCLRGRVGMKCLKKKTNLLITKEFDATIMGDGLSLEHRHKIKTVSQIEKGRNN